ncbi:maleate cis-trans isomerase family protein [Pseudonocardia acaciae]|uniref:maleate cis-trans isomerase family protein n=1 Tax=Pseudonocardia acaciae TaxID=551276 RepID=UPI00048E605A|nr:hypothetical protein [Pseudonocardia acaciae]
MTKIGLLYPTRDRGEDDYLALAAMVDPATAVELAYVPWGPTAARGRGRRLDAAGKVAALRELGEIDRLCTAAEEFRVVGPEVVSWTCSSGSFLWGLDGARKQAHALAGVLGVPASSTSLAFLAAIESLGVSRVALASVYSTEVTDGFIAFLAEAGVETVSRIDLDARSDRQLAGWGRSTLFEMVELCDVGGAEAVLVPETALHTAHILGELEERAGKPVLTATGVTMWDALRRIGRPAEAPGCGALFDVRRTSLKE